MPFARNLSRAATASSIPPSILDMGKRGGKKVNGPEIHFRGKTLTRYSLAEVEAAEEDEEDEGVERSAHSAQTIRKS